MIQTQASVLQIQTVAHNLLTISLFAPEVSPLVQPGQFINVKVGDLGEPLLRRPFSVYQREGTTLRIIFNIVGSGTLMLSRIKPGDNLDIIGPLGHPFNIDEDFDTAILIGGGLGVAPLPMLTEFVRRKNKRIVTFLGARTADQLVPTYLESVIASTDDGSAGFHGTVVDCFEDHWRRHETPRPKVFACGPTPMLKALAPVTRKFGIPCEVSLESVMACGIGICQGCPVELQGDPRKYALVCKDGTVFNINVIRFS